MVNRTGLESVDLAEVGINGLGKQDVKLVILLANENPESTYEVLRNVKQEHPHIPVIVGIEDVNPRTAITSTRYGAYDCVLLSDNNEVERAIHEALELELGVSMPTAQMPAVTAKCMMVGVSSGMQQVYKTIGRVAATNATVLITGETGTGKELVAQAIHAYSLRHELPMVTMNCAAIPENLLESMMFGHEKGAFTGATERRIGKFTQADKGTIFLDEIGELPLSVQAKLLRVVQYNEVEPLGSNKQEYVDVRILAATNQDLEARVAKGEFREDLYHRLNVVPIHIPSLRTRRKDILPMARFFLQQAEEELGIDEIAFSSDAIQELEAFDWPGNARQLRHCLTRAIVHSTSPVLTGEGIRQMLETEMPLSQQNNEDTVMQMTKEYLDQPNSKNRLRRFLDHVEREMLSEALHQTGGNQTAAARILGISRTSVQAKMKKYNMYEEHMDAG